MEAELGLAGLTACGLEAIARWSGPGYWAGLLRPLLEGKGAEGHTGQLLDIFF